MHAAPQAQRAVISTPDTRSSSAGLGPLQSKTQRSAWCSAERRSSPTRTLMPSWALRLARTQMPWQQRLPPLDGMDDEVVLVNVPEAAVHRAVLRGERLEFPALDSIEPSCPHTSRVSLRCLSSCLSSFATVPAQE